GVIEAARVEGVCRAVQAVRERVTDVDAKLGHADFWQLHHMFAYPGWLGPAPQRPPARTVLEWSTAAAEEYRMTLADSEAAVSSRTSTAPRTLDQLAGLCDTWGLYFMTTRFCLFSTGDDLDVPELNGGIE